MKTIRIENCIDFKKGRPAYRAAYYDLERADYAIWIIGATPEIAVGNLAFGDNDILNSNLKITFEEDECYYTNHGTVKYAVSIKIYTQSHCYSATANWYDTKEEALGSLVLLLPKLFNIKIDDRSQHVS